jgi:hypothetical protein
LNQQPQGVSFLGHQFTITTQIVNKKIIFIFVAFLQKILKINFKIREFTFTLQWKFSY